jgi:hypothetical protein
VHGLISNHGLDIIRKAEIDIKYMPHFMADHDFSTVLLDIDIKHAIAIKTLSGLHIAVLCRIHMLCWCVLSIGGVGTHITYGS